MPCRVIEKPLPRHHVAHRAGFQGWQFFLVECGLDSLDRLNFGVQTTSIPSSSSFAKPEAPTTPFDTATDMTEARAMVARMASLSTEQVAREVGIGHATLERWLASGKVPTPKTIRFGKFKFRDWTPQDVGRVRKFKQKNYRRRRGRRPKRRNATRRR